MKILLLEDGPHALKRILDNAGFEVVAVKDRKDADRKMRAGAFDIVVVDLDLPHTDSIAKTWRNDGVPAHIVALTSNGTLQRRLDVLSTGADDCIAKPYEHHELLARLRVLTTPAPAVDGQRLTVFDLEINAKARAVKRGGVTIPLTGREFELLHFLAIHRGKPVSRASIREHLYPDDRFSNVIDVYVRYLRKKIDKGYTLPLILTCRGKGYMLRGEATTDGEQ